MVVVLKAYAHMIDRSEEQGVLLNVKFSGICGRNYSIRIMLLESTFSATSLRIQ